MRLEAKRSRLWTLNAWPWGSHEMIVESSPLSSATSSNWWSFQGNRLQESFRCVSTRRVFFVDVVMFVGIEPNAYIVEPICDHTTPETFLDIYQFWAKGWIHRFDLCVFNEAFFYSSGLDSKVRVCANECKKRYLNYAENVGVILLLFFGANIKLRHPSQWIRWKSLSLRQPFYEVSTPIRGS